MFISWLVVVLFCLFYFVFPEVLVVFCNQLLGFSLSDAATNQSSENWGTMGTKDDEKITVV